MGKVEIKDKVTITIEEAAEYSSIGKNKLYEMTNKPSCPFVLNIGKRGRLIKRKEFEKYIERTREI